MRLMRTAVVSAALTLVGSVCLLPVEGAYGDPPSTTITIPTSGATVSGTGQILDAAASSGVTQVQYEITGGTLTDSVIATATPTIYGWLARWNTTVVPNGSYTLQSVASHPGDVSGTSLPVTVIVNNPPPSTTVTIPTSGATEDSSAIVIFDASASPGVTQVQFVGTSQDGIGMSFTLNATPTIYGWLAVVPGETCSDCTALRARYSLQSVASYPGGVSGTSSPVTFTIIIYTNFI